ncbi:agamous-like MADS-box protein AGL80 [Arachis stenosperma]|uniref:agamous-like MADS-box protein AGL80 n=1 Tax=Arachis stenosperma TaxID=217475 RepID=UPI0025AC5F3E|nr:agamous-like MADS-box protein AGL80 [Arachis stenosperma]
MGRGKTVYECIKKERERKISFMQRKDGIMKKIATFSKLCKVEACLIIYEDNSSQPMIWPQEHSKVQSIIEKYEVQKNNETHPIIFDEEEFFKNKKIMIEAEISKLRKKVLKFKYPTMDPIFTTLDGNQLMEFIALVNTKIEACKKRIDMLKESNQDNGSNFNVDQNQSQLNFMNNIPNHDYALHHDNLVYQTQNPKFDPNVTYFVANNNGMIMDSISQVNVSLDCSTTNQVAVMDSKEKSVIVDSTNQISENGGLINWNDFVEVENWIDQLQYETDLKDILSHQSQNVSQSSQILPPITMNGFLADEKNNNHQFQSFNR